MHCVRREHSIECLQTILSTRLLEIDLDYTAPGGKTTQDCINELNYHKVVAAPNIRAIWNSSMHWLKTIYYPSVQQLLQTYISPLECAIVSTFLKPIHLK
jgi:hypothetical protein